MYSYTVSLENAINVPMFRKNVIIISTNVTWPLY
jgi:hypothetical protein